MASNEHNESLSLSLSMDNSLVLASHRASSRLISRPNLASFLVIVSRATIWLAVVCDDDKEPAVVEGELVVAATFIAAAAAVVIVKRWAAAAAAAACVNCESTAALLDLADDNNAWPGFFSALVVVAVRPASTWRIAVGWWWLLIKRLFDDVATCSCCDESWLSYLFLMKKFV